MGRILAIDPGKKRCGFAISDELKIIAKPLAIVVLENEKIDSAIDYLEKTIAKFQIEKIVLGYPLFPSGQKCEMTFFVEEFYEKISKKFSSIKVFLLDERNSSLVSQKIKNKKKKFYDDITACVLLEDFFNKKTS